MEMTIGNPIAEAFDTQEKETPRPPADIHGARAESSCGSSPLGSKRSIPLVLLFFLLRGCTTGAFILIDVSVRRIREARRMRAIL